MNFNRPMLTTHLNNDVSIYFNRDHLEKFSPSKLYTPDILVFNAIASLGERNSRILDVGCGDGRFVKFLLAAGFQNIAGCDPLYNHPSLDEKNKATKEFSSKFEFNLMQSDKLPYLDSEFDWIVCNQVFEHVQNKEFLIQEMSRILKPTGKAIVVFPTKEAFIEHHVKLPWFQIANLKNLWVQMIYRTLVLFGLGAYPRFNHRNSWISDAFISYSQNHFYVDRLNAIQQFQKHGFLVNILDEAYFSLIAAKYPSLKILGTVKRVRRLVMNQVGVALLLIRENPIDSNPE